MPHYTARHAAFLAFAALSLLGLCAATPPLPSTDTSPNVVSLRATTVKDDLICKCMSPEAIAAALNFQDESGDLVNKLGATYGSKCASWDGASVWQGTSFSALIRVVVPEQNITDTSVISLRRWLMCP
jgi:hypothetical protein